MRLGTGARWWGWAGRWTASGLAHLGLGLAGLPAVMRSVMPQVAAAWVATAVTAGVATGGPWWAAALVVTATAPAMAQPQAAADPDAGPDETRQDRPGTVVGEAVSSTMDETGVTTLPNGAAVAYRLEVSGPRRLRELLLRHLDLARFREQADISPAEIGRLLMATPAQARALLETEGFFDARIEVQRIEPADGEPPLLRVGIEPGAQARVGRLQIEIQGALAEAIEQGDAAQRRRWERLQARWSLPVGAPFSQAAWDRAKTGLLNSLSERSFASASLAGSGAEVDAAQGTVRIFLVVDSGPAYRIGAVRVEGLERTPQQAALNVMPFRLGVPYSEQLLLDYQETLQKAGLYEGTAVELDLDPARADEATVIVRLREQHLQSATVSAGFSSNTGPRVGLEHTHRRLFGRDLVGSTRLKLGRDDRSLSYDLLSYPLEDNQRNLLGVQADYLNAGGAVTLTQRLRAGRTRSSQRLDTFYYLELNQTTLETANARTTDRAVLGNYEWVRREVDSLVFPTRGLILSAQGGAGYARDAEGRDGPFGRVYLEAVWYQPLGAGWFGQFRGEVGEVFRRGELGVPDSLLFRAGGDTSVRGYGYRTLGPEQDGSVVGGLVMATGTVELMRRLSSGERWRDWFGAVFVDAGQAASSWKDFSPVYGYGAGVRWRSPIGPVRGDLAYGQALRSVRLHVSVGVTF